MRWLERDLPFLPPAFSPFSGGGAGCSPWGGAGGIMGWPLGPTMTMLPSGDIIIGAPC